MNITLVIKKFLILKMQLSQILKIKTNKKTLSMTFLHRDSKELGFCLSSASMSAVLPKATHSASLVLQFLTRRGWDTWSFRPQSSCPVALIGDLKI